MPLFRRHRGSLEESLKTTIIVYDMEELKNAIKSNWNDFLAIPNVKSNYGGFKVTVFKPYDVPIGQLLDKRCGWYTHYVTSDILEKDKFIIEGFLSEPFEGVIK